MIEEKQSLIGNISSKSTLSGSISGSSAMGGKLNNPVVETGNYNKLTNKPSINGVELITGLKSKDLFLQDSMDYLTNLEIERLIGD